MIVLVVVLLILIVLVAFGLVSSPKIIYSVGQPPPLEPPECPLPDKETSDEK